MLDFAPLRDHRMTYLEFAANLTIGDLAALTNEMVDAMLEMIRDCGDADVVFTPVDPEAEDQFAADAAHATLAWTLGHVIAHTTASAEESAFLAAELARGVEYHGRSRSELPWASVTTIAQCRQRLAESRRMRLATLEIWPDQPHLDNTYQWRADGPLINATARFVLGLRHDDDHLGQIADIVRQARASLVVA